MSSGNTKKSLEKPAEDEKPGKRLDADDLKPLMEDGGLSDEELRKAAGGGLDSEFARWLRDRVYELFKRKS